MTAVNDESIKAGQAVYSRFTLKIYDLFVLNLSNRWIWRCPKRYLLEQYNQYVSDNHLDIGVGTGYFLAHCHWPRNRKLSLMDLNTVCLEKAKKAVYPIIPTVYQADIYKTNEALFNQFDSISINYLLHCLPGTMDDKSIAIANAVAMLKPGGVLLGATILSDEHLQSGLSRRLMRFYNKKNIFSNKQDDYAALHRVLNQHLKGIEMQLHGCVALFKGIKP